MNSIIEALDFLHRQVRQSSYIRNKCDFISHGVQISYIVDETRIASKLKMDNVEMRIAGLLHDIGRCVSDDDLHHPITGADFLEEQRLNRIAKIIRTHNFIKEVVAETGYKNIDPESLNVTTWQEAFITYASMICGKDGQKVSFDEKLEMQRKKRDDFFMKISTIGEPRIREIYNDVELLKSGNKDIIKKYEVL